MNNRITEIQALNDLIIERCYYKRKEEALLVAISGIDASGKGYTAEALKVRLEKSGRRVALIHLDDWQQLKAISLLKENAAENFYFNSFRWDAIFNQAINPLKKNRSVNLLFNKVKMECDVIEQAHYDFKEIDIILLEGVFLFRKEFRDLYDFKIWIECSFETGLQRALKRNMEGLPAQTLLHDYHTYYYPAQRFHFERDHPKESADVIFENDGG